MFTCSKKIYELVYKNPRKQYLVNVNPMNEKYKEFLKKENFKLFSNYEKDDDCPQDTFELKKLQ